MRMESSDGLALARPVPMIVSAKACAERGLSPLTCKLAREVRSM